MRWLNDYTNLNLRPPLERPFLFVIALTRTGRHNLGPIEVFSNGLVAGEGRVMRTLVVPSRGAKSSPHVVAGPAFAMPGILTFSPSADPLGNPATHPVQSTQAGCLCECCPSAALRRL
jgi:hypothetical protein